MDLMNRLTDKRKWAEKICNEEIVAKLKEDILAAPNVDISEKMVDWVGFHVGVMVSQRSSLYQICAFKSSSLWQVSEPHLKASLHLFSVSDLSLPL